MSRPNLLLLQIEPQASNEVLFLNLKPTTNDVYWRNYFIFLYFFVQLLRALPTFLFRKLLLFFIIHKIFQNQHVVFSDRMSLRRLAKLYKNPRARLNLSVSPV